MCHCNKNLDLTPHESLVLRHVLGGYRDKEIARLLDISYRTVQCHRYRARKKLKVKTPRELVVAARERGIQPV